MSVGYGGPMPPDPMDTDTVLERLNQALELQHRSVLQLNLAAGSLFGLEVQAVTGELQRFAEAELDDTRRIVEKIAALGGDPATGVAEVPWHADPREAMRALVDNEDDAIAALHAVIPHSGQEPHSEALEHLMEHLIMRKQNQVDWLRRALR
jgi:bacterioferritin (cytochrome b1)